MSQRLHLAVVPPKPPRAPVVDATFTPLVQEFLEECGYSDK
jgi:hypothetical protein